MNNPRTFAAGIAIAAATGSVVGAVLTSLFHGDAAHAADATPSATLEQRVARLESEVSGLRSELSVVNARQTTATLIPITAAAAAAPSTSYMVWPLSMETPTGVSTSPSTKTRTER